MNGDTTGLEPANSSGSRDLEQRRRHAVQIFGDAAKAAAEIGEWKLEREATDAKNRTEGAIEQERIQQALQLGSVDGEDPQDAGKKEV